MTNSNRMLLCVSLAIVGAAGCASGGGMRPPDQPPAIGKDAITLPDLARRRSTRIVVYRPDATKECKATIDDYRIIGKPGKKVAWLVEDNSGGCALGNDWQVELEFDNQWNNGAD